MEDFEAIIVIKQSSMFRIDQMLTVTLGMLYKFARSF